MKTKVKIVNTSNPYMPQDRSYDYPPPQDGEQGYIDGYVMGRYGGMFASVVIDKNIHAVPIDSLEVITDTDN